ncbi:uncharacterized protein LOC126470296 isoform X2 [Schistocerca serialis cubense]|uniref:uncharacterized protein LOC126470296 isoform X2 n=1 Tax=Schistocerca serialis cubense TaxID=2023355 RepID=UPI00214E2F2A|nr:uncharacterized protein LOC126470296 isoform X2 [Schistocerca serialis cubense]
MAALVGLLVTALCVLAAASPHPPAEQRGHTSQSGHASLDDTVASTGKRGLGSATTEEAVGLPHWEDLLRNFISAPDIPCGFGQLGNVGGLCRQPDGERH